MKVYVASKWENKKRVQEVMSLLKASHHEITYDWTHCEVSNREQAILDLRGVAEADVVIGIFEDDVAYKGALVEVGAALALGKPVYVVGNAPVVDLCIFFKHPNVHLGEDKFLLDFCGGR